MQNSRVTAQTRPLYSKTYRHNQRLRTKETDNIMLFHPIISSQLCSLRLLYYTQYFTKCQIQFY